MLVPYKAFSPADPRTGAFTRLLPYAGDVHVEDDADPYAVLAALEAAVNEFGHVEAGAQVRIETEIDGKPWEHTYDAPEA
jgi:hypothetical protein